MFVKVVFSIRIEIGVGLETGGRVSCVPKTADCRRQREMLQCVLEGRAKYPDQQDAEDCDGEDTRDASDGVPAGGPNSHLPFLHDDRAHISGRTSPNCDGCASQ